MKNRNLKITLSYDGTRFVGWQRQATGLSIQGLLEEALAQLEGASVTAHGAGRTDAGVHALAQVASACVTFSLESATIVRALNALLPPDIRVMSVEDVSSDFHARFGARSKRYRYQIAATAISDPFMRAYAWHVPEPLEREAMRAAAAIIVGTHDFAAFQSTGTDVQTTVRTVTQSAFVDEPPLLVYIVEGDGFLRHMVRAIVGTLVDVGRGRRPVESVATLLAGGPRAQAGATAPAHGLTLASVEY